MCRLDIIYVSLRRYGEGRNKCQDSLLIRDISNSRSQDDNKGNTFCGSLPGFHLILSSKVELQVQVGELEAEMPDMIGFALVYESISKF